MEEYSCHLLTMQRQRKFRRQLAPQQAIWRPNGHTKKMFIPLRILFLFTAIAHPGHEAQVGFDYFIKFTQSNIRSQFHRAQLPGFATI